MHKLVTRLGVLVLLVAVAYGFYWYQVKSKVDKLVQQAAPFAQVSYGRIYAHPDGTVGVNQLTITPRQMHAPVSVESVRVRVGSPVYFLFGGDELPERISLSLKRIKQGLDSEFFRAMQRQADFTMEANPLYVSPNSLGCGNIRRFDINTLKQMGFNELVMDMDMDYRGDFQARKVSLNMLTDVDNMGTTRMEMEFTLDPRQLKNPAMASGSARLESLSINYRDTGYNQRRNRFCAAEIDGSPADYQQQHRQMLEQWLTDAGVELPEALLTAYFDLVLQPGSDMALSMRPAGGLGTAELMLQDPEFLLQSLNLQLSINDKPVPLDGIDWAEMVADLKAAGNPGQMINRQERAEIENLAEVPAEEDGSSAGVSILPKRLHGKLMIKQYRPTPPSDLRKHIGAQVRIFTYFGNNVEGRLIHADSQGIRVLQRLEQGVAEYPLEYERIQQAEVWR